MKKEKSNSCKDEQGRVQQKSSNLEEEPHKACPGHWASLHRYFLKLSHIIKWLGDLRPIMEFDPKVQLTHD